MTTTRLDELWNEHQITATTSNIQPDEFSSGFQVGALKGQADSTTQRLPTIRTLKIKLLASGFWILDSGSSSMDAIWDTEYFSTAIGPVKRVSLTYGPNGVAKGIVTIVFSRPESAAKAMESLDGVHVDDRPMKIEVVLDAAKTIATAQSKGLSDRIKPKPVSAAKPATNGAATRGSATRGGRGRDRGGRRGRNAGRGKPKNIDELDAEMVDYFVPNNTNGATTNSNGTTQPAVTADASGMDEIAVTSQRLVSCV
ncbi:MAG: hypothetical protein Q9219_001770 [cf. Caloplaca sp. 3 TL-2023]